MLVDALRTVCYLHGMTPTRGASPDIRDPLLARLRDQVLDIAGIVRGEKGTLISTSHDPLTWHS